MREREKRWASGCSSGCGRRAAYVVGMLKRVEGFRGLYNAPGMREASRHTRKGGFRSGGLPGEPQAEGSKPSSFLQGVRQALMYYGVSFMQTFVEFGVFALLQLWLPTGVANGAAVACSGAFNFLMNRNITFKASSNFWRSVALFVALYVWNYLFGTWFMVWTSVMFGCPSVLAKFITMAMQGVWGFCLCKWVIFK